MSDAKKAALALAKAEAQEAQLATQVANAGLHMTDYQPSPVPFFG